MLNNHPITTTSRSLNGINTKTRLTTGMLNTRVMVAALVISVLALASFGCSTETSNSNANTNANLNGAAVTNTNSNTETGATTASPFESAKEPQNYSLTLTISGIGSANNQQRELPPQQIDYAKMGTDYRWGITLPAIGQVTYLEKAGQKYLITPARNQYVQLAPEELGFRLGDVLTPTAMVEHLKPHAQYESLGTETINGRTATKYRFAGEKATGTQAGTVQADSFVYVDQDTSLPLRADINLSTTSGATARIAVETRDINLNPSPTLFDVPTDMKKVSTQELKQQVQSFVTFVQVLAQTLRQQGGETPMTPPTANSNANRPAANANRP